jgi:hypothetical protein
LLGAALYFTGWIYRWRYFGFFQLEVTTLDLPLESFLMVPLQVFFGNNWAIAKTFLAFTIAGFLLLIAKLFIPEMANFVNSWRLKTIHYTLNRQLEKPYNRRSTLAGVTKKSTPTRREVEVCQSNRENKLSKNPLSSELGNL